MAREVRGGLNRSGPLCSSVARFAMVTNAAIAPRIIASLDSPTRESERIASCNYLAKDIENCGN
ncbi:MAG: hypothetical protein KDA62_00290 [Planctomycetales bacterium]|nr:hypothetical protein [Planctomycetales bacterium]MCA9161375.1 hypothetical protein [Planctomycetales bacterium]